ncbi:MAG: hypothetical protein HY670_10595 [Chloroflexi bacterium]|nr:hypothetical protein [Chloroflexota bacterium]
MAYQDQLECPHCHRMIDIETEIEGDDGYMNLYPIVKPAKLKAPKETRLDEVGPGKRPENQAEGGDMKD